MEDSMDMDMSLLRPQNYLFGCELKADKDYNFKVDNDENEHQLSLQTVSLGAGAKDELHIVEAEAMNYKGSPIKVTLATLKMSVQPMLSLGGFEITPPVVLKLLSMSGKHSTPGGGSKVPQKKVKLAADENDEDDEKDDDDDDDFDDEEAKEKAPEGKTTAFRGSEEAQCGKFKASRPGGQIPLVLTTTKKKKRKKKKDSKPSTPRSKGPSSVENIKAKMQTNIEKDGSLPKVEAKFINY
uniref:Nucleophosmin n=1 Tax=Myotis lucifugus TaxID=59463 RepID=G1QC82_MYOLU